MADLEPPTLLDSYEWAVVRVATFALPNQVPRLLFGIVSLLTKDRPAPVGGEGLDQFPIGLKKDGRVYFRKTVLSVLDAIRWYRSAESDFATPIPSRSEDNNPQLDGRPLSVSLMADDPAWPTLGLAVGSELFSESSGAQPPFVGAEGGRIHRRFGDDRGFEALTTNPEAAAFLQRRLHVDLSSYTEYLGSLVLVAPDPIVRHVHHFVVPDEAGQENLVYRFTPRTGQSLSALKLTVIERRANLLSRFETIDIPENGLVVLPRKLEVQASGYAVTHPEQGILAYQPPVPFIRSIGVSLGVAGRKVKIATPMTESPTAQVDTYEVTEFGIETPIQVGERAQSALTRIFRAEEKRRREALGERQQQTWFEHGERTKALSFLRRLIAGARSSVLVADPYFGGRQIYQVLHAVPRTDVAFTLLTSRLAFEGDAAERADASTSRSGTTANGEESRRVREERRIVEFRQSMNSLAERGLKNAAALILNGKTPRLHDRFLVIDDTVWFLGNSLNALGDRASLILQVPNSNPILAKLRQLQVDAVAFETYVYRRQRSARRKDGR